MDKLLWLVPALGCGLGMVLCMVVMGRMMGGDKHQRNDDEVAQLRDEVARLRQLHDETHAEADG